MNGPQSSVQPFGRLRANGLWLAIEAAKAISNLNCSRKKPSEQKSTATRIAGALFRPERAETKNTQCLSCLFQTTNSFGDGCLKIIQPGARPYPAPRKTPVLHAGKRAFACFTCSSLKHFSKQYGHAGTPGITRSRPSPIQACREKS
jgi:hypothetical protein